MKLKKQLSTSVSRRFMPVAVIAGLIIVILGVFTSFTPVQASGVGRWVAASPSRSCSEVCSSSGLTSVVSSRDNGGFNFHVCRGLVSNGELRPGFNIETSADSARLCLSEYGGGRARSTDYDCLCLTGRPSSNR